MSMGAQAWDERYARADLVWSAGPNATVAQWCADLPPGRAVDLGAGEGRNGIWLAQRGWDVTAVDFSSVGLERARSLAAQAALIWLRRVWTCLLFMLRFRLV